MHPRIPVNHYPWHTNQQSRQRVLSCYSCCCIHHRRMPETLSFPQSKGSEYRFCSVKCRYNLRRRCPGPFRCSPARPDRLSSAKIQLRAFKPQQLQCTLLELEFPRLLTPDLPSNRLSKRDHSCQSQDMDAQYCYFLSPPCVRIGQFAQLLPFLRSGSRFSGFLSRIEP